ncbi:hypothetical protein DMENIID0001_036940 [Sergentomyia squamirostris]
MVPPSPIPKRIAILGSETASQLEPKRKRTRDNCFGIGIWRNLLTQNTSSCSIRRNIVKIPRPGLAESVSAETDRIPEEHRQTNCTLVQLLGTYNLMNQQS